MTHDIQLVSKATWDLKIAKFRNTEVFPVVFFKDNAESKELLHGPYNELADFLKGLMTVAAVDCDESPSLCDTHNIKKFPTLIIFPPLPFPPYEYKGKMTRAGFVHDLSSVMKANVLQLDNSNVEKFLNANAMMPSVVLVSDKEHPPFLYRALANAFATRMNFGFVAAKKSDALVKKFKAKQFPHLVVMRREKKDEVYRGEMKAQQLFEWLNIFSETFVMGGGFSDGVGGAAPPEQPWKYQSVPEMTAESHLDICFRKTDQGLCVVYLRGDGGLDGEEQAMLERLKEVHTSQVLGRGIEFRWSWMNIDREPSFKELLQPAALPSVVVFNPHKRLRFTKSDQIADEGTIKQLLERISGGDARFTNVKSQKLPPFANRKDEKESSNNNNKNKKSSGAKEEL